MSNIFLNIGLLVTVIGMGTVVYVLAKYRDMDLTEDPGELQFSNLKNIPGEDYVDLNVVKVGKTRTLGSFHSSGSIKWEAFFNPKTSEDMERRKPAAVALVACLWGLRCDDGHDEAHGYPGGVLFQRGLVDVVERACGVQVRYSWCVEALGSPRPTTA